MEKRLIDVNSADVERINCRYSDSCRLEDVQDWLNEQPTVDAVELVHGRWEDVGDNISDLCFRCSACKAEYSVEINMNTFARYCPNCGAKMDGDGNG